MSSYAALTDEEWVEFLQNEGISTNVNFWSPGGKPLRSDLPGNRIFLFARVPQTLAGKIVLERRFVGSAYVVGFEQLTVEQAWNHFGFGNGAPSLDEMLRRIGKFGSVGTKEAASTIGCTVLDDLIWFETPVSAAEISLEWPQGIVRGKTLDAEAEHGLDSRTGATPASQKRALAALSLQFKAAPPQRKEVISKRIERNSAVVRYLKSKHPQFCQYCGTEFFLKRGARARYCEIHHLKELGDGGLDVVDNCVALCANCHRRFHYADISVELSQGWIIVHDGSQKKQIARNVISI